MQRRQALRQHRMRLSGFLELRDPLALFFFVAPVNNSFGYIGMYDVSIGTRERLGITCQKHDDGFCELSALLSSFEVFSSNLV